MEKDNKKTKENKVILPKEYTKPQVISEDLMAFAASCNGTENGGRKSSVGAPAPFCNARKLNS